MNTFETTLQNTEELSTLIRKLRLELEKLIRHIEILNNPETVIHFANPTGQAIFSKEALKSFDIIVKTAKEELILQAEMIQYKLDNFISKNVEPTKQLEQ